MKDRLKEMQDRAKHYKEGETFEMAPLNDKTTGNRIFSFRGVNSSLQIYILPRPIFKIFIFFPKVSAHLIFFPTN